MAQDKGKLILGSLGESEEFSEELFWSGTVDEYFELAIANPLIAQSAYQRLYHAIVRHGGRKYRLHKQDLYHYNAFDHNFGDGSLAIFGLDYALMRVVSVIRAGAQRLGQEQRFLLLHGPVGSSKSTVARLFRELLIDYSRSPEGAVYTYEWIIPEGIDEEEKKKLRRIFGIVNDDINSVTSPLHEDPFKLIPVDVRNAKIVPALNAASAELFGKDGKPPREKVIEFEGTLNPYCRYVYKQLLLEYGLDWKKVIDRHIRIKRIVFSEEDRIGIGSFRPKDEKNQDSTELTGDINYRKIAEFGSESDPRVFNFDGEFQVANRGLFYAEETLKLDQAFLYDFLGATQEHQVKPKRHAEMYVDVVLMGGTNNPEFEEKLRDNPKMEAFADRTTRIDVPYILNYEEEQRIYDRIYAVSDGEQHRLSPHTSEVVSKLAVFTRLREPEDQGMDKYVAMLLYSGRMIPGFTEDKIRELILKGRATTKKDRLPEGMTTAISARKGQDMLSAALVENPDDPCVTPFAVFQQVVRIIENSSLGSDQKRREEYESAVGIIKADLDDIIKGEVQEAIGAEEGAIERLFDKYLTNVLAYVNREKVKDPVTGDDVEADETLMRSIETQIQIGDGDKDDYRAKLVQMMGTYARREDKFNYKSDELLSKALKLKLFHDRKDYVNLSQLRSGTTSKKEQDKIDTIRARLMDMFGYCDFCADQTLMRASSLFKS